MKTGGGDFLAVTGSEGTMAAAPCISLGGGKPGGWRLIDAARAVGVEVDLAVRDVVGDRHCSSHCEKYAHAPD
jgi:hypothetical protein